MEYCEICPSADHCTQCQQGYNFTDSNECVDEAFLLYGNFANMSGFTSNITEVMAGIYLGTSAGPCVFGEMGTTYFNIEFTQFILFHANASGGNP